MGESQQRYSAVSLILHWLIAALILAQVILVNLHEAEEGPDPFVGWHKAVGLTILVLTLVRLGWRIGNPAPALPVTMPKWERVLSRLVQGGFYLLLVVLPLTGWLASSAAGRDISWFGLFNWPLLPVGGGREAAGQFMDAHELAVKALWVLLVLHVGAALKHQFIDKDNVLHRMLPIVPAPRK